MQFCRKKEVALLKRSRGRAWIEQRSSTRQSEIHCEVPQLLAIKYISSHSALEQKRFADRPQGFLFVGTYLPFRQCKNLLQAVEFISFPTSWIRERSYSIRQPGFDNGARIDCNFFQCHAFARLRQGVGRTFIVRYAPTTMSYLRPMIHLAPRTVSWIAANSTVNTTTASSKAIESRSPSPRDRPRSGRWPERV